MKEISTMKFIKTNKKIPLESLDVSFHYEDVKDEKSLAVLIEEPYVVLDVDDDNYFRTLCNIIKDKKIKCKIMKTSRGGHFWFKYNKILTNSINTNTPITLKTDIKCWGKKSLVTVKKDGIWREWIQDDENVDELPFWLFPIKTKKDLYGLKDGDGRDPELYSYIFPLINNGFNKDQIKTIFYLINDYIFDDPLKPAEIDKMFENNDAFSKKELMFFNGRSFLHNIFVDWLMESYCFRSYGNQVYIYYDGLYVKNDDEIFRKMIEQIPNLTRNQMMEAYENLRLKTTHENQQIDCMKVNLKNGIYDLVADQKIEHSPYIFTINRFNCNYNPNAYCKDVDDMLNNVSEDNPEIRSLLEQMLGYLLIGDCRYQKAFILLGQGSNGKSKFLEMIMSWIGMDNCSTLALEDLSERFRPVQLVGKVANIGDDSGGDLLKNTAIFKKIVTGDGITVEYKHGAMFSFNNSSKLLFSANNLPPSSDKSDGFFRRIILIPFNATFKAGNKNFDPYIIDKVTTDEARDYLFLLALKGYRMLLANDGFIVPTASEKLINNYELDNNSILQWVEDMGYNLLEKSPQEVYTEYCLYCNSINVLPVQIRKFNAEIIRKHCDYTIVHELDSNKQNIYKWKRVG